MPNSRCIVIVTAVGHWRKDEGFSEKIFGIPIIESMFVYDFINFPSRCQAARINCRVIATLSTSPKFSAKLYPLFQTIFNRAADPEGIVTQNNYCSPGLGAEASTSTKPPISAVSEMGGFCKLYRHLHCLHRYCSYDKAGNRCKEEEWLDKFLEIWYPCYKIL